MSTKSLGYVLAAAIAVSGIGSAAAAVMVLGAGPEKECYEAAKAEKATAAAIKTCDAALSSGNLTNRDTAATFTNRAALLLGRDEAAKALSDSDRALTIAPSMTAAAVNRSAALIRLGRYEEARAAIDAALPFASGEELKRGLYNRAMANEALGDVKAAYRDLKRAIEVDPAFEAAKVELTRYSVRRN